MNKERMELDLVDKAHQATHKIRQPSWAAHCMALSINLDEAAKAEESMEGKPTIKVRTPAYSFNPTPICGTPIVLLEESRSDVDSNWEE